MSEVLVWTVEDMQNAAKNCVGRRLTGNELLDLKDRLGKCEFNVCVFMQGIITDIVRGVPA